MKIVVLVKDVPDTYGDRKLNLETGLADRDTVEMVMDEVCERSLEVAPVSPDGLNNGSQDGCGDHQERP